MWEFIIINYDEKEKFKTDYINTYPQIYLMKKNSNGNLLLGGYNELNNFINIFKDYKNKNKDIFYKEKNNFINNNTNWSNKATLRLIQLISSK